MNKKNILAVLVAFIILPPFAWAGGGAVTEWFHDWQSNGLVWCLTQEEVAPVDRGQIYDRNLEVRFSGVATIEQEHSSISYAGYVDYSSNTGAIQILHESDDSAITMIWDLSLQHPVISLEVEGSLLAYPITAVIMPSGSACPNSSPLGLRDFFPEHHEQLEAVLNSASVEAILPKSVARGLGLAGKRRSSCPLDDEEYAIRDIPGWGCGLVCGGVIGAGFLTVVTAGSLTPGLITGAASCGSCMGFLWGTPVVDQQTVVLPPGGDVPIGLILPPLPPGWMWTCEPKSGGGYTCRPTQYGYTDPY